MSGQPETYALDANAFIQAKRRFYGFSFCPGYWDTWVMAQPQFLDTAKMEFQAVADGWLTAYAKAKGKVVVTLEEYDPVVRKKVPLPNVCRAFDVEWITPFEMLRRLNVKLSWDPEETPSQ